MAARLGWVAGVLLIPHYIPDLYGSIDETRAVEDERARHLLPRRFRAGLPVDALDRRVREDRGVKPGGLLEVVVEPQRRRDGRHACFLSTGPPVLWNDRQGRRNSSPGVCRPQRAQGEVDDVAHQLLVAGSEAEQRRGEGPVEEGVDGGGVHLRPGQREGSIAAAPAQDVGQ